MSILKSTIGYCVHIFISQAKSISISAQSAVFFLCKQAEDQTGVINLRLTIGGNMPREHAADRYTKPDPIALSVKKHEGMAIAICSNY